MAGIKLTDETGRRQSRKETSVTRDDLLARWVLLLFLSLYLISAIAQGILFPLGEGPDEPAHFSYADHIARTGRLPVLRLPVEANESVEAHQPPLYYALASLFLVFTGQEAPILDYRQIPPGPREPVFRHHPSAGFPWHGRTLGWHLIRMFTAFLGLLSLWITFHFCRITFEGKWLPVAGVGYLALNPQYAYLNSRVSNDSLAVLAGSVLLLLVARTARMAGESFPARATGVALSIALLSKLNAPFLFGGIIVGLKRWASGGGNVRRRLFVGISWMLGLPLVLSGWWFLRNWQLYGDPSGIERVIQVLPGNFYPETQGPGEFLSILPKLIKGTFQSSWPFFGWRGIELPRRIFNVIAFLHLLVWGRLLLSIKCRDLSNPVLQALAISTGLFFASFLYFNSFSNQAGWSGRLLFPASACAAAVFVAGSIRLFGGREKLMTAALLAAGLALNVYTYWWIIAPAYLN